MRSAPPLNPGVAQAFHTGIGDRDARRVSPVGADEAPPRVSGVRALMPRSTESVVRRSHNLSVTNPTGNWALENLAAFEELFAAIEQMSLEAGAAGDSVKEFGSLGKAAPSVDIARERVARAAAAARKCPPPPDAASAWHLAAMLEALDEFRTAKRFNDWVRAWTRAMEHNDAFARAFAIANGQQPEIS
jgi:hypothetical protein